MGKKAAEKSKSPKPAKKEKAGKKEKKEKKEKDPNAPKRPKSAYLIFSVATRPQVKNDNPEMTFGDIAKEISTQWAAMSEADKKTYNDQAAKDKTRYEKEKADYDKKNGKEVKSPKKKASK